MRKVNHFSMVAGVFPLPGKEREGAPRANTSNSSAISADGRLASAGVANLLCGRHGHNFVNVRF